MHRSKSRDQRDLRGPLCQPSEVGEVKWSAPSSAAKESYARTESEGVLGSPSTSDCKRNADNNSNNNATLFHILCSVKNKREASIQASFEVQLTIGFAL